MTEGPGPFGDWWIDPRSWYRWRFAAHDEHPGPPQPDPSSCHSAADTREFLAAQTEWGGFRKLRGTRLYYERRVQGIYQVVDSAGRIKAVVEDGSDSGRSAPWVPFTGGLGGYEPLAVRVGDRQYVLRDVGAPDSAVLDQSGQSTEPLLEMVKAVGGSVVLRSSGRHVYLKPLAVIDIPDGGSYRFPVAGRFDNGLRMQAVDEDGNVPIRFRAVSHPVAGLGAENRGRRHRARHKVEAVVALDQEVTDAILLMIIMASGSMFNFVDRSPGGGEYVRKYARMRSAPS